MNESNLHNYQNRAANSVIDTSHLGLLMEMGLGKTISVLTAINKLMFDEFDIMSVLIVAPKRVTESVWAQECLKWEHTKHIRVSKIIGNEKQRRLALHKKADIHLISRDNIAWLCGLYGGSMLPFDMLVVDESSSFKNPKSVRFKALRSVQPSFNRVVILTGTPAPNGLIDLWSQIYLLDRGERLGRTISMYRRDYFRPGQTNGHIVYNYRLVKGSEQLIHNKIGDICISMKSKDYLDLPERINNTVRIEFPPELQKRYNKFEKEQVLRLFSDKEEEISAVNAAALSNKLLQFANGAVYDDNKDYHEVHTLKLDAAEEIIEDANGSPVLIAWTYRHDMYRLKERLKKYKPRELKKDEDIQDWNAGKIQVLLMHPASGGHGLNLQTGGNIIVWFGQTWSLELEQQLNARLDRQGQTKNVVINRLIAVSTIDEDVVKAIQGKSTSQNDLMVAIKARINKYRL